MASISVMFMDNENGVSNFSFVFSNEEIKRIADALRVVYKDHEVPSRDLDTPTKSLTDKEVYSILSESLVSHVINTCQETEINVKLLQYKQQQKPIELKTTE